MTPERWAQVEKLYHAARARTPKERPAFLDAACAVDAALRREVESLLAQPASGDGFLEEPAVAIAAQLVSNPAGSMLTGRRIGAYQLQTLLGAGGMGEVYRARDPKLGRDVAIKILPQVFTSDPERLARFEREARMLAALNHPHIGAIYGLEDADGVRALVLELVEGETLADRLRRGPVPLTDALTMALQIAEAIETAHEKGIIHRDLKPANIKIAPNGAVKVLDFGLAKVSAGDGANPDLTQSPTMTMDGTRAGVILGTAAYMSPEQARGHVVDKRTDIWAFGCVLFEMLTGQRAFGGDDVADTIAAVVRAEPDWGRLPANTPAPVRKLLRGCLQKDVKKRRQAAGDVRIDLEDVLAEPVATPAATPARGARLAWTASLAVGTVLIVALAILAARDLRQAPPLSPPEIRTEIITPATTDPISFALSPDGRQLVFVASGGGPSRLWLRPLTATSAQPLAGTEGAVYPFWSPDSRSVGFFADGKLERLDVGSGPPQVLTDAFPRGGTWNADGIVLFTRSASSPLFRVSAAGGAAVAVTKLNQQVTHRFPFFLPDGRHFLFFAGGAPVTGAIYLGSLDAADTTRLTAADAAGVYLPSGWLAWVRAGVLVAQRLDLTRRVLAGDPVTVADPVGFDSGPNVGAVSVSATGLVAYRSSAANRRQLTWFDHSGKALGTLGAPDENGLNSPRLSPDGRRVVVYRELQGNWDLWLLDGARTSRFTFDAAFDRFPVWSPDGSRIAFDSNRTGTRNLYVRLSSGAGSDELLLDSPQDKAANDWSADGRFLLYHNIDPQTNRDLWVLPLEGDRKPWVLLKTPFNERWARFSPDGRWVAYVSNESGRDEIYVRPFVHAAASTVADGAVGGRAGGQWQVSTAGGNFPRWRADGKELYYLGPDGQLMAAPIAAADTTFEPGAPVALFHTHIFGGGTDNAQSWQYDVARDGRFLINTVLDEAAAPITLLQNWKPPLNGDVAIKDD